MVVLKWAVLEGAASPLPSPADRAKLPAYGKNRGAVMSKLRGGLIQMGLKAPTDKSPEEIRKAMLDAHIPLIEEAGKKDVQVLCFQEVFNPALFLPEPGFQMVCRRRALPRRPDHQADAGPRQETRDGHRRADLRGGDDRRLLQTPPP